MTTTSVETKQRKIIKSGFKSLKTQKKYSQKTIVNKIISLGFKTSEAAFSNIINDKDAGSDSLYSNYRGIMDLVYSELGIQYDGATPVENKEDWTEFVVPENPNLEGRKGFSFKDKGRLTVTEKNEYFSKAQKVIYEVGVTLNTFTNNFFHVSKSEFKEPFENVLRRGVSIKCYLLDPECSLASAYFNDRATVKGFEDEKHILQKTRSNLRKLKGIYDEFEAANYIGKFELYTYKHIPTNNFLAVDPKLDSGVMNVSHYLFGQLRANNPVIKFTRHDNSLLFKTYWESMQEMIRDAQPVNFDKYLNV